MKTCRSCVGSHLMRSFLYVDFLEIKLTNLFQQVDGTINTNITGFQIIQNVNLQQH